MKSLNSSFLSSTVVPAYSTFLVHSLIPTIVMYTSAVNIHRSRFAFKKLPEVFTQKKLSFKSP